jgi:hypothetical protein
MTPRFPISVLLGLTQDFVQQKDIIMKTEIPTSTDAFGEKATHTFYYKKNEVRHSRSIIYESLTVKQ